MLKLRKQDICDSQTDRQTDNGDRHVNHRGNLKLYLLANGISSC